MVAAETFADRPDARAQSAAAWRRRVASFVIAVMAVLMTTGFAASQARARDWSTQLTQQSAVATHARVEASGSVTRFKLTTDKAIWPHVFALANPYRIVIDIAEVRFHLPPGTGTTGAGLISQFRYGLLAPGRGRIVLDLSAPVAFTSKIGGDDARTRQFILELRQVAPSEFQGERVAAHPPPSKPSKPPLRSRRERKGLPIVVIDPGHGGVDPGAIADKTAIEKNVTLGVGLELRKALRRGGRVRVVMTRVADVYVSLDARVEKAANLGADLFISLHADAVADKAMAVYARGATIYLMSNRASDRTASRLASKENASDSAAGVQTASSATSLVRSILIDLVRRESADKAAAFRERLLKALRGKIKLGQQPRRSAEFRVLRQVVTPSVLVELGYMSHPRDRQLLRSSAWQAKVAGAIAKAVEAHFRKTPRGAIR